nr:oligopeptide/dipeptide ABC transporter ATP-binding protein [Bacillus testis]
MNRDILLKVNHLKKHFPLGKGKAVKAVDGVSLHMYRGETLGIVGESGCGKSTLGRSLIGLYQPTEGEVIYGGRNLKDMNEKERFAFHRNMQMVFQDPYASLNPRSTVAELIAEPMDVHGMYKNKQEKMRAIVRLLEDVGLNGEHANRYPHEFSGGQRQRIGIARALALNPEFIIADEPISALDVSVQAQVINLLKRLQKEKGLTFLFIAHDLSMVKQISDRIGVMYLGHMVEMADSRALYERPFHPYTQALLSAVPIPDPDKEEQRERIILKGEIPSPIDPPSGCTFRTRCRYSMEACATMAPRFQEVGQGHYAACHLYDSDVVDAGKRQKILAVKG